MPTDDGRLVMATPDGLWAVLTIFEIGRLRDALRRAALALHRDNVKIEVLLGQWADADGMASNVASKRVRVVFADYGRLLPDQPSDETKRAS